MTTLLGLLELADPQQGLKTYAGVAWAVWFEHVQGRILETDPDTAAKLEGVARQPDATVVEGGDEVPWRAFLRNTPVRALAYTHFCNNWWVAVQQQLLLFLRVLGALALPQPGPDLCSAVDIVAQLFAMSYSHAFSSLSCMGMARRKVQAGGPSVTTCCNQHAKQHVCLSAGSTTP